MIEMPDRLAQNLILYIRRNDGTLSKRKRETDFSALTDDEVRGLESIVNDAFDSNESQSTGLSNELQVRCAVMATSPTRN
jgi:hypothetical protein